MGVHGSICVGGCIGCSSGIGGGSCIHSGDRICGGGSI